MKLRYEMRRIAGTDDWRLQISGAELLPGFKLEATKAELTDAGIYAYFQGAEGDPEEVNDQKDYLVTGLADDDEKFKKTLAGILRQKAVAALNKPKATSSYEEEIGS